MKKLIIIILISFDFKVRKYTKEYIQDSYNLPYMRNISSQYSQLPGHTASTIIIQTLGLSLSNSTGDG